MLDLTTLLKCWSWPGLSSELDQEEVRTLAASSLWQIDISSDVSPALTLLCQTAQLGVCAYFFKNRSWGAKRWWRWWWRARWPTSTALTRDKEQWAALKHTQCALRFIEQSSQYETNFTIYCCSQQHRGILCNCDHQKPLQTHTQTMGTQIYLAMQKKREAWAKT